MRRIEQKTRRWVDNETAQTSLHEKAELSLVAAYINRFRGVIGQKVKFRMSWTMDEAVRLAVTVENAEQQ